MRTPAGAAPVLRRNLETLLRKLIAQAADRAAPSVDLARGWHRSIFEGAELPVSYGEWARIHPFANGNGRIARLWANWCAMRYGLPPFLRLRPRPEGDRYARAAGDSMAGDHRATVSLFADWLEERLRQSG